MRTLIVLIFSTCFIGAKPSVVIEVPNPEAWTGERLPFYVELRAPGSFKGAPTFDLPEVKGSVIMKIGNPTLGSLKEDETEIITQRHEFALFSQLDGTVKLPPITARFSHMQGYSGEVFDVELATPSSDLFIKRPPESENLGFLVTTDSLVITETWDPLPDEMKTGDVIKRTITQTASNLTGIALAPASNEAPTGIRVYTDSPKVADTIQRGTFSGKRTETITYLVQEAGLHALPELSFNWWNPKTETLESKKFPPVEFTATAPPVLPDPPSKLRFLWLLLPAALLFALWKFHKKLKCGLLYFRDQIDPPSKRKARALIRACQCNNLKEAEKHWADWQRMTPTANVSSKLNDLVVQMHRSLYGPGNSETAWDGGQLAMEFKNCLIAKNRSTECSRLPKLNS
ncbi:MAG: hypothetical protein AB8D78_13845 [Akkermansiaceae bacterium]